MLMWLSTCFAALYTRGGCYTSVIQRTSSAKSDVRCNAWGTTTLWPLRLAVVAKILHREEHKQTRCHGCCRGMLYGRRWVIFNILSQSAVQPFLYEAEWTDAELRRREEERDAEEAAAARPAPERPSRANSNAHCQCLQCPPMPTDVESVCCTEWEHRDIQFIFDEFADDTKLCITEHISFSCHLDRGVLTTYFSFKCLVTAACVQYPI